MPLIARLYGHEKRNRVVGNQEHQMRSRRKRIDGQTYEALLTRWRFAPLRDPLLQGEMCDHYVMVMGRKKSSVGRRADCGHQQTCR